MSETKTVYLQPRSIGGITMDVTVEESHTDELDITEHPVEQGASVTDHAYLLPSKVTIVAGASDSGGDAASGASRCREIYEKLLELQGKREPFDLFTGKRAYKNMLIKSLGVTTDRDTERVLLVTAELRQVILASVQSVSVPRSRQRKGHVTGGVDERGQQQLEKKEVSDPTALKIMLGG